MSKTYRLARLQDLSEAEIERIVAVIQSGESALRGSVRGGLGRSILLSLCELDRQIIGVVALRNSSLPGRRKVFRSAGANIDPTPYKCVVGYAAVLPEHRGSPTLLMLYRTLGAAYDGGVYGTVRDERMARIASRWGFMPVGRPFARRWTFSGFRLRRLPPLTLIIRDPLVKPQPPLG